jgi:SAM dependent carboxyl methyltransferase
LTSQVPFGLNNATEGPINKTSFWISKKSPPIVSSLYLEQFVKDFSSFLKYRSEELCSDGRMALIFPARTGADPSVEKCAEWISWYEEVFCELEFQVIKLFVTYILMPDSLTMKISETHY